MTDSVRRLALASAASAVLASAPPPRACAADAGVRVTLTRERAGYQVEGSFLVRASSAAVWGVLTDYDHIADFVPSMRRSRTIGTAPDGAVLVEQKAVGGAFFVRRTVSVTLEVRRSPAVLSFRDVSGRDFRHYSGRWSARAAPFGTLVTYRLSAAPDFPAPGFFVRRGLSRGARDLLSRVRDEILRRAAAAPRPR